jgi:hypothetical protein
MMVSLTETGVRIVFIKKLLPEYMGRSGIQLHHVKLNILLFSAPFHGRIKG